MTESPLPVEQLKRAAEADEWNTVEELWLAALEDSPSPTQELLSVARALHEAGHPNRARTLLELLLEVLEEAGDRDGTLEVLRAMVGMMAKPKAEMVEGLETALVAARKDSPSLDKVVRHCSLTGARRPLEALEAMECWLDHDAGTPVEVVGHGVGRVLDLNLELENVKVDVGAGRPLSVPFGAVSRYIRRLPEGSFLYRKVTEPEALAGWILEDPGAAFVHLLESLREPADVATIRSAVDGVLPSSRWTSWWAKARKHPRVITSGTGSRLKYGVGGSAETATLALLDELRSSDPRARLAVTRRMATREPEAVEEAARILAEGLGDLEGTDPGLAWETSELLSTLPGGEAPAKASQDRLLEGTRPLRLLLGIADRTARLALLDRLRERDGEGWADLWSRWLLHEEHPANLTAISGRLDGEGAGESLDAVLETVLRNHLQHPAQFVWACERMTDDDAPKPLRRRLTPSLLERLPDTFTRKEFSALKSRAKGLLEGGKAAIRVLLETASPAQAERFAQRLIRIQGLEPQHLRLVEQAVAQRSTGHDEDGPPLFVATAEAVEAKRKELAQLLDVEIPKTLKGINAAAAEGDLRENFEYHMLRDRQELLSARAAKIQEDLARVRVLEPGAADASRVNIATVIHLEREGGETLEPVTILGQWDSDVGRRVYANGTELAEGLLGREVGDTVQIEGVTAQITAIAAWPV